MLQSFPPVAAPDAKILILGSMPGVVSLAAGQYYAHPRNAFWPIMGKLMGAAPDKPYETRLETLKQKRIALWDVLRHCRREGSLDSAITCETANDFPAFLKTHPRIAHIFLNGNKAAQTFRKYALPHLKNPPPFTQLLSTSPANASYTFDQKLENWRQITGNL